MKSSSSSCSSSSLLLFIILNLFFSFNFSSTIKNIKLGVILPSISSSSSSSSSSTSSSSNLLTQEEEAAFLLAIQHINNKNDGFYDNLLSNYNLKFGLQLSLNSSSSIISLLDNLQDFSFSSSSNYIDNNSNNVNVIISTNNQLDNSFSNSLTSPIVSGSSHITPGISINPTEAIEGIYLQHLLCSHFDIRNVVLFTTMDYNRGVWSNLINQRFCNITITSHILIYPKNIDHDRPNYYSLENFNIKESFHLLDKNENKVYMILLNDPTIAGMILDEGYIEGFFSLERQIFLSSSLLNYNLRSYISPSLHHSEVSDILRGVIGIRISTFVPPVSISSSFYSSWISQSSTWCSTATDDTISGNYLHRINDNNNNNNNNKCYGLNFSSTLYPSVLNINPSVAYMYDSVIATSMGLHSLLVTQQKTKFTKEEFLITMKSLNFVGVTGPIKFGDFGNRIVGFKYDVMIFNYEKYISQSSAFGYSWLGTVDDNGFHTCSTSISSSCILNPIYNTIDNSLPTDKIPYKDSTIPQVIKIGGLFKPFDSEGNFNSNQAQYLASFLMAIREINNKTDGMWDDILPNTKLVHAIEIPDSTNMLTIQESSSYLANEAFGTGVSFTVLGVDTQEVNYAQTIFTQSQSPTLYTIGDEPVTGAYKVQVCPISTDDETVIEDIICNYFKYKRLSLFVSGDTYGFIENLQITASLCNFEILSYHSYPSGETIDEMIMKSKISGANVFLFMFSAQFLPVAAMILEKGYDIGLFPDDTQIFGGQSFSSDSLLYMMSSVEKAKKVLKGLISIEYSPSSMLQPYSTTSSFYSPNSKTPPTFIERWRNQPLTSGFIDYDGDSKCVLDRDDADRTNLYAYAGQSDTLNPKCGGFNFSSFKPDGSDLAPYVGHNYDGVIAIAIALDQAIKQGLIYSPLASTIIVNVIMQNLKFQGVTGEIGFYPGLSYLGQFGRGTREVGQLYKVKNFQTIEDDNGNVLNGSFIDVGMWTSETGLILSNQMMYRTKTNNPPKDRDPDTIVELASNLKLLLLFIGSLSLLTCFIFAGLVFIKRKHKYMIASQTKLLSIILLGGMISSLRVINTTVPISDTSCITGLWEGHIGFLLVFITLVIKSYRLYLLLQSLKRRKFTQNRAVAICLMVCFFGCIYLFLLTFIGKPHESSNNSVSNNQVTRLMKCNLEYSEFHTALFSIEAVILILGFYFAYKTKDAPDSVNEAKYIASAIILITIVCSLVFPVIFLIGTITPATRQLISSLSIGLLTIIVMFIVFLPKMFIVFETEDINDVRKWDEAIASAGSRPESGQSTQGDSNPANPNRYIVPKVVPSDIENNECVSIEQSGEV